MREAKGSGGRESLFRLASEKTPDLCFLQAALALVHTFGLEPAPAGTEKRNG
jgi:hypothetical protein